MSSFGYKYFYVFIKESYGQILIWPFICVVLFLFLWMFTFNKIDDDKKQLQINALKDVSAISGSYAQYLTRSLEQIDQVTKHVKFDWETSRGKLRLEDLRVQGLFIAPQFTRVAILDKVGNTISSTVSNRQILDENLRWALLFHQQNNSSEMQIVFPDRLDGGGKQVLHFTRRLEANDESFDGIVVISVDAAYFTTFFDEQSVGKAGLLLVLGREHLNGISRIGNDMHIENTAAFNKLIPPETDIGAKYVVDTSYFIDKQSRFLGWHRLSAYPITAVIGLSKAELLGAYLVSWNNGKNMAGVASFFLLLFTIIATRMSATLAWRKYQEKEIQDTYRLATEGAENGFYMLNTLHDEHGDIVDFVYVDCNVLGAKFFGLNRDELIGVKLSSLQNDRYFKVLLNTYCKAMETGFHEDEYQVPSESPIEFSWARRRLARSGSGLAVTISDISIRKQNERELVQLANKDELTGLFNRHWLLKHLPLALDRARTGQYMLAILFVDLDGFKGVNDTRGHAAGDQLLKSVSSRLQSVLRPTDHVIRLGGDEFVVLLEPVYEEHKSANVAERICESFEQAFLWNGDKLQMSASIGISLFPRDGDDTETLLKSADIAMYSVKAAGKNHYNFFRQELYENLKKRFELEQALIQAIELDQFVLYYQPRVDACTGRMVSMEALIRWNHPERGVISPLEFIPVAETSGLILRIGDRVMDIACAQIAAWKRKNIALVPVSINVSARQFQAGDLHSKLNACLEKYDVESQFLEVEITESAMMGESSLVIAELMAIRALGIELLVDDFGTGYSSLSQLQRLDMDVLKVDRVFTDELGKSKEGEIFYKAIISMAHALDMRVVAEGVETREQLMILRALECDEIQGYFVSRPVPSEQMASLMREEFLLPEIYVKRAISTQRN
jgi:diguanylate cyclase (GGDEF)-like protein